jgi:hypothetical protein
MKSEDLDKWGRKKGCMGLVLVLEGFGRYTDGLMGTMRPLGCDGSIGTVGRAVSQQGPITR